MKFSPKSFLILFLIIFVFSNCKKEEEKEPASPDVIIPETTKIISKQDWQNYIQEIDSADWTIRFNETLDQAYEFEPGDIIVTAEGEGLLRRITEIEKENNTIEFKTEQAALEEAVEKGSLEFSETLQYPEEGLKGVYLTEGVEIKRSGSKNNEDIMFTLTVNVPVHEHVDLTGELTFSPTISGQINIDKSGINYLEINFDVEEQLDLITDVTISSLELEKEITLAEIPFPTIVAMIGPLPVTLTPTFTVNVGVNVGVSSTVSAGLTQDLVFTASVVCENEDWSTTYDLDKGFDYIPPSLNNTAEAKTYVQPELAVKIYGTVAPNISSQLYGLLEAELGASPWWSLYAGLSADIGVKVKILFLNIADFSVNVFDYQYLIAEASGSNTNPMAVFTVEPESGDVETIFEFDGSESYDNEDPTSDLMVRWDFNGDGTWDTDWNHDKITEHKYFFPGNHEAKMEIKDTEGLTNSTTQTVMIEGTGGTPCPGTPTVTDADGNVYNTVLIGDQCWMKENLRVGTMIQGEDEMQDNGVTEKWCFDNEGDNCLLYGGLYSWDEMMQYTEEEGVQGICPDGWHLPTDEEWKILEGNVDSQYGVGDPEWDEYNKCRGADVGYNLKADTGWMYDGSGSNAFGFSLLPGKERNSLGGFTGTTGGSAILWTSTDRDLWGHYIRYFIHYSDGSCYNASEDAGLSVRCLKD